MWMPRASASARSTTESTPSGHLQRPRRRASAIAHRQGDALHADPVQRARQRRRRRRRRRAERCWGWDGRQGGHRETRNGRDSCTGSARRHPCNAALPSAPPLRARQRQPPGAPGATACARLAACPRAGDRAARSRAGTPQRGVGAWRRSCRGQCCQQPRPARASASPGSSGVVGAAGARPAGRTPTLRAGAARHRAPNSAGSHRRQRLRERRPAPRRHGDRHRRAAARGSPASARRQRSASVDPRRRSRLQHVAQRMPARALRPAAAIPRPTTPAWRQPGADRRRSMRHRSVPAAGRTRRTRARAASPARRPRPTLHSGQRARHLSTKLSAQSHRSCRTSMRDAHRHEALGQRDGSSRSRGDSDHHVAAAMPPDRSSSRR